MIMRGRRNPTYPTQPYTPGVAPGRGNKNLARKASQNAVALVILHAPNEVRGFRRGWGVTTVSGNSKLRRLGSATNGTKKSAKASVAFVLDATSRAPCNA